MIPWIPRMQMTGEEMDELVDRVRRGDRGAFRSLVIALEPEVRFAVGAFDVTGGLADEAVQATFVSAYQKLDQYRGGGAFRAWCKAIARNHVMRMLRDQKRFAGTSGDLLEEALVTSAMDDVERMDELEHQTRQLRRCLEGLPARLRNLVDGRYVQGMSTPLLARQFQRSDIWVRVTLCRARQTLRRCIERNEAAAS